MFGHPFFVLVAAESLMHKGSRILVVDDDRRMARTLSDILQINGYRADAVFSGNEALDMAKDHRYDCLITDIQMAPMNGVELQAALRKIQPLLQVILITAYATHALVDQGMAAKAAVCLVKPLDVDLLLDILSAL